MRIEIELISKILNYLTLLADTIIISSIIIFIFSLFSFKVKLISIYVSNFIYPYSKLMIFLITLIATSGSLFFSDIAKLNPCLLCWWQRIFMYPQVLLVAFAILKNDNKIKPYLFLMNLLGGLISLYHYLLQIHVIPTIVNCQAVGFSESCSERFSLEYGYISIPMMALSAFCLNLLILFYSKTTKNNIN